MMIIPQLRQISPTTNRMDGRWMRGFEGCTYVVDLERRSSIIVCMNNTYVLILLYRCYSILCRFVAVFRSLCHRTIVDLYSTWHRWQTDCQLDVQKRAETAQDVAIKAIIIYYVSLPIFISTTFYDRLSCRPRHEWYKFHFIVWENSIRVIHVVPMLYDHPSLTRFLVFWIEYGYIPPACPCYHLSFLQKHLPRHLHQTH